MLFQLILNPIRDWNISADGTPQCFLRVEFQLILNPIRDWNCKGSITEIAVTSSN